MNNNIITNRLHLVCGRPGVGKSTYAQQLAEQHKAVLLDIDVATESVVQAGLRLAGLSPDDRDTGLFKDHFREPIHDSLFSLAKKNLPINNVVIAAPFSQELQDPDWLNWLKCHVWSDVKVYVLVCDKAELFKRIQTRANPRDTNKLADWPAYQKRYVDTLPSFSHQLIDTSTNSQD